MNNSKTIIFKQRTRTRDHQEHQKEIQQCCYHSIKADYIFDRINNRISYGPLNLIFHKIYDPVGMQQIHGADPGYADTVVKDIDQNRYSLMTFYNI